MDRLANWLFVGVLICSTLVYAESIPQWTSYGLVVAAYATFTLYVLAYVPNARPIVTRRYVFVTLAVVWGIYLAHALLHLNGGQSLPGVLAAIAASAIGVVLVPQVIDRAFFFRAVSRLSAAVVLIGLPAFVFGSFSVLGVKLWVAPNDAALFGTSIYFHPLRSYFANQNFLSVFLVCGLLASLYEFHVGRRRVGWLLVGINAAGLLAAYARAGLLIGAGGVALWAVYRRGGVRAFQTVVVAGVACAILGVVVVAAGTSLFVSVIPVRLAVWEATMEAIAARPLGYGQVPAEPIIAQYIGPGAPVKEAHNGYLRVAFATGILGGLAYVVFVGGTLVAHLRALPSRETVILFVMALALAGYMFTENFMLFGINSSALLTAVTFGYAAREALQSNTANAVSVPLPSLSRWPIPRRD